MKPVIMILQIEGERKRNRPHKLQLPHDVDAEIEKCHDGPKSLEGVAYEQDADCFVFFGRDDLENVGGDDPDEHHGKN